MHESVSPVGTVYPITCHQGFCQSAKKSSQWCNCLYSRPNTDRQTGRHTHIKLQPIYEKKGQSLQMHDQTQRC